MANFDWLVAAAVALTCLVASSFAVDGTKLSLAANDLAALQGIMSKIPNGLSERAARVKFSRLHF